GEVLDAPARALEHGFDLPSTRREFYRSLVETVGWRESLDPVGRGQRCDRRVLVSRDPDRDGRQRDRAAIGGNDETENKAVLHVGEDLDTGGDHLQRLLMAAREGCKRRARRDLELLRTRGSERAEGNESGRAEELASGEALPGAPILGKFQSNRRSSVAPSGCALSSFPSAPIHADPEPMTRQCSPSPHSAVFSSIPTVIVSFGRISSSMSRSPGTYLLSMSKWTMM